MQTGSQSGIDPETYSHSIVNETSKLLICNTPEADTQNFTVIFTVKLGSASIGAGLQAIRQEATFRDLSTSIDSSNHRGHRRRRIGVGQGNDQEGLASNALTYCPDCLFRPFLYRHDGLLVVSCESQRFHRAAAGANGLAGRCLSLDMRK